MVVGMDMAVGKNMVVDKDKVVDMDKVACCIYIVDLDFSNFEVLV